MKWRQRARLASGVGVLALALALAVECIRTMHRYAKIQSDEEFSRHCTDFLEHRISAEELCQRAQPRCLGVAMMRRGKKVPASLPLSGIVTLKGQTDHSGTEVAVVVWYDTRALDPVIISPFHVVTDTEGRFDLSTLKLEAWQSPARRASCDGLLWNTCEATPPVSPPIARFYVRHKGFDWRVLYVSLGWVPSGRLVLQGKAMCHVGGIELLPEGSASPCYLALGAPHYPVLRPFAFLLSGGHPDEVRKHLETHPDCCVADDALYSFLLCNYSIREPGRPEAVADGFRLFRDRFMNGKDNTGLSMYYQPGVSPDGSWAKLIEDLESRFLQQEVAR